MEQTNFEKVLEFNQSFEVNTSVKPQHDLYDVNPALVQHRLDLIIEEVNELKDSIGVKDLHESVDALADILYVVYGAFTAFGVNADKAFDLVHQSNMSKLCKNEAEAQLTVDFYNKDGRYKSPAYRKSHNGTSYIVYDAETTKVLKSINYNQVSFTKLLNSDKPQFMFNPTKHQMIRNFIQSIKQGYIKFSQSITKFFNR